MIETPFAIEMYDITKTFGDNFKANDSVNFKVTKGEIHALVGENGAGKSTLMKILYGMYHPTGGKILINGKEELLSSPSAAIHLGIGMVHQHFMLVGTLSVLENIILGDETTTFDFIDYKSSEKKINSITQNFNINIDLKKKVETLPVGIQQKIEILKILYRNADILILDEPTAVLTPQETDELFNTLKELKREGKTIILITHKLGEVLSISDSVTVLRHGKLAGEVKTASTNKNELAKLIVGGESTGESDFPSKQSHIENEKVILSLNNVTVLNDKKIDAVRNVSFQIKSGEILGIAGVEGNGQTELIEAINGLRKLSEGELLINGKNPNSRYPIAHIPADRHKNGVVMEYSVADNVMLGRERENIFSTPLAIKKNEVINYTNRLIDEYDIRPKNAFQEISGLSGGNQQKVVAARELTKKTELIIASHPTRGLDIKATNFVHTALVKEKNMGKAILVVSSDLQELLKLSDRIAVMYNGEITAMLSSKDTNEREIGLYMTGMNNTINN